jgi:hypothetical protein
MVNGPRIYMSRDDYDQCMAATGGTRYITVEAKRLRFGGFTVARLIEVQTREGPPLVINKDPITPPPQQPDRRHDDNRPPRAVIVNPR